MSDTERRADDGRIKRVEEKVTALSEDLRQHIVDENNTFTDFRVGIERLATNAEHQTQVLDKVTATLDNLAAQNSRLVVVETLVGQHDKKLPELEKTAEHADEQVARLYWLGGLAWTALGAIAAVVAWLLGGK